MNININEIIPTQAAVFEAMGVNQASNNRHKLSGILSESLQLFTSLANPVNIVTKIGLDEFSEIYHGEGQNEEDNVLMHIYPRAENLELFALTLGEKVSTKIEDLFQENEYPTGYMLDSIASIAADKAAEILQDKTLEILKKENLAGEATRVLSYSPGYCGWHISGQKKLFKYLEPGKIGISLTASYLMTPIKSVSGVLVAGSDEIHRFTPNYPFCKSCLTHSCLQRMRELS
jgi:hypothetical protein